MGRNLGTWKPGQPEARGLVYKDSPIRRLALAVICSPSSSAPVEGAFSTAGMVINQHRGRLNNASITAELLFSCDSEFVLAHQNDF